MKKSKRSNQRTPNSLNQSMFTGLPNLSPENMHFCISKFYQKRLTSRLMDSPPKIDEQKYMTTYHKDVECLREEILFLKKENLRLKQTNQQLLFQIKIDEREQTVRINTSESSECNQQQYQKLLEKLKQARAIINVKNQEIETLKKNKWLLKNKDLEAEMLQLKQQNQILLKQQEEFQKDDTDQLKLERFALQIMELEEKLRNQAIFQQKQKRKCQQLRQELATLAQNRDKLKKSLLEKCEEFEIYKKKNEQELQTKSKYKEQIEQLQEIIKSNDSEIKHLNQHIDKLKVLLIQKQKQIKEIEEQYQAKRSFRSNKREVDQDQQILLDTKMSYQLMQTEEESQTKSPEKQNLGQSQIKSTPKQAPMKKKSLDEIKANDLIINTDQKQLLPSSRDLVLENDVEVEKEKEKKRIKLPRVDHYDVEQIGKYLKMKFMSLNIPFEQLDQYLPNAETISIEDLIDVFEHYPFEIENLEQRTLMARYMIEDNSQIFIMYDSEQENDLTIIRSVLKNLIGRYQLFSNEEEAQIKQNLQTQLNKFKQSIYEQLKQICLKKPKLMPEHCEVDDLSIAIQQCNIQFENREKEYLAFTIFIQTEGAKQFDYRTIIEKITTN